MSIGRVHSALHTARLLPARHGLRNRPLATPRLLAVSHYAPLTPRLRTLSTSALTGRLQGKTAIITGASSGLGRATAFRYSNGGANIVCADIRETTKYDTSNEETRGTTHDRINENGGKAVFVSADVTNPVSMENLVERAVEAFGRLDVMVNNAGVAFEGTDPRPVWDVPMEMWEKTQAINSTGVFLGTKVSQAVTTLSNKTSERSRC